MTALPDDDELSSLLSDLNDVSGIAAAVNHPASPAPTSTQPMPQDVSGPQGSGEPLQHNGDQIPPPVPDIDLPGVYNQSVHELLQNYRKDRSDLDSYISFLYGKLNSQGPSRIFFEAIAMSLRTKSEANNNLIKLLDNVGKRIENKTGVENLDLEGLLDD